MDVEDPVAEASSGWTRGRIAGLSVGVALALVVVGLLVVGLVKPDQEFSLDRKIGENEAPFAPAVTLPVFFGSGAVGPEGTTVSLESLRGKPVVVNLWASWCPPCRSEAPILQRLAEKYEPKGVVVLGINVRDLTGDAKAFIDEFNLTFPTLRDGSDDTEQRFEAGGLPETFLIDPDGKMRILPFRGELTVASERDIAAHLDEVLAP